MKNKKAYVAPVALSSQEEESVFPAYVLGVAAGYAVVRGVQKAMDVTMVKRKPFVDSETSLL